MSPFSAPPTPDSPIPFNRPYLAGQELGYMTDAVARGHVSGSGHYTRQCEDLLERSLVAGKALLTTSCTHALEMAALLLDLGPGDEVLIPTFTFVSTANAFALRGARPVFVDVRPDTLNLDEAQLEERIGPTTRAMVPVHYAGVGCEMAAITPLAAERGVVVIEDNAHGLFATYDGQYLGTFGQLATQSFHETKNFTCGEGGALLVNDLAYADRARIILDKGTDRSRFLDGLVDRYTWVDVGSSYPPADILAAYLFAQLEAREDIHARRARLWQTYDTELAEWAAAHDVGTPVVPARCGQSFHMYYLVMPSAGARSRFIEFLAGQGVMAVFHYAPLHLSAMGKRFGAEAGDCPVAESISERLVRLPFFTGMSEAEQARVIDAVTAWPGPGAG